MRIYGINLAEMIIFAILVSTAVESQKWSNYNSVSKKSWRSGGGYGTENENDLLPESNAPAKSQQSKPVTRHGIGGWEIIAITLTVIFSGVGIYYFVLFYPIVCKKERMYDVIGMVPV